MHGGNEKMHTKTKTTKSFSQGWPVIWQRFKLGTSQI